MRRALIFILLTFVLSMAASGVVRAERLPVRAYSTAEGLAGYFVSNIVEDSRGFLWFCTSEGVSRFDGYQFTNYGDADGIPGGAVNDLLEARDGIYWLATTKGLVRFDPRAAAPAFEILFPPPDPGAEIVRTLHQDAAGAIWAGTFGRLYRIESGPAGWAWTAVATEGIGDHPEVLQVNDLADDGEGGIWIATRWAGLLRLSADGFSSRWTVGDGLPSENVRALAAGSDGSLWVTTRAGLAELRPGHGSSRWTVVRTLGTADGLTSTFLGALLRWDERTILAGSPAGLVRIEIDPNGSLSSIRTFQGEHGLAESDVSTLARDRSGNLWVGSIDAGAVKIARNGFTNFGGADGIRGPYVRALAEDRRGMVHALAATPESDGYFLNHFDGQRFVPTRINLTARNTGWGSAQVILESRQGDWWVATGEGLERFRGTGNAAEDLLRTPVRIYTTKTGLRTDSIYRMFEDSRGGIWLSAGALVRIDSTTGVSTMFGPENGYTITAPQAFAEDHDGGIWFAGYGGGLAVLRNGSFTSTPQGTPLPEPIVNLFIDSAGRLWIATDGAGLGRMDDPATNPSKLTWYSHRDGLSSNVVTSVTEDRWGRIYIGTGRGVDRLETATGYIRHYTLADGLPPGQSLCALRDRRGDLWFATNLAVARFSPTASDPAIPPPVLISGLSVAGAPRPISFLGESEIPAIRLSSAGARLDLEFLALSFAPGETLRYQYRLSGVDADWSPPLARRAVTYASLSPGTYRFEVRAVDSSGLVSPSPAAATFLVLPPFWRTWWFGTMLLILIATIAFALHRARVRRLVALERVRTRIATDLHDDLGSSLSQIAIVSEVIRRQHQTDERTGQSLRGIAETARGLVESLSDIVWSVDPQRDHIQDLSLRMRRAGEEMTAALDVHFDFQSSAGDLSLDADVRRGIYLAFKESVNNAIKHSECSRLEVGLSREGRHLRLTVRDDGKGFAPDCLGEGLGLAGLKRRAREMGGTCEIQSSPGVGTTVQISVPIAGRRARGGSAPAV